MTRLTVRRAGPLMTVQDLGRPGHIDVGLSPGGAMDRLALIEAAALLGQEVVAGIEMAVMGGEFTTNAPLRFALTGARMDAQIDGRDLQWNATHRLQPGEVLRIGGVQAGTYGYLIPAGGITSDEVMGSVSAHLSVGLGAPLATGDVLTVGQDPMPERAQQVIASTDRLSGGTLRLMPGPQTDMFDAQTHTLLSQTQFFRSPRTNRTGSPLTYEGQRIAPATDQSPVSDFIRMGDVQITGDGTPFIMLSECQTIGGYPRIGTVIAADIPRAAQASSNAPLRFAWVTAAQADALYQSDAALLREAASRVQPLLRNPAEMPDLLSYQLIDGVTAGDEAEPAP